MATWLRRLWNSGNETDSLRDGYWHPLSSYREWRTVTRRFPAFSMLWTKECGQGGDCLFHSIAKALCEFLHETVSMQEVRNAIAQALDSASLKVYIASSSKLNLKMAKKWVTRYPPAKALRLVQQDISTPGNLHQGEENDLLLTTAKNSFFAQHGIGFVVVSLWPWKEAQPTVQVYGDKQTTRGFILLYNDRLRNHYTILGIPPSQIVARATVATPAITSRPATSAITSSSVTLTATTKKNVVVTEKKSNKTGVVLNNKASTQKPKKSASASRKGTKVAKEVKTTLPVPPQGTIWLHYFLERVRFETSPLGKHWLDNGGIWENLTLLL